MIGEPGLSPEPALSRRGLLGAGAVAALAAAGCGDRTPAAPAGGDAGVLAGLLAVERALAGAWEAVAALPGPHRATARDVLAHERAHVARLAAAGAGRGARPAPAGVASAARRVRTRAQAGDAPGALEALYALEHEAGAARLAALPALRGADARVLATGLIAAGAQHGSIVLLALGRNPLPDAFAGTLA